jgi:ribonuclease Z
MSSALRRQLIVAFLAGIGLTLGLVVLLGAGGTVTSPTGTAPDRYVYYPGTEPLAKQEIRLIACGTGMPAARHAQAATCFLAELGNGDKFLFDIGTGSMANVAALMIPYDMLDRVFLTHLHTDHMGDIDALWAGGWTAGRSRPLQVWGPSGARPEMGTKHSMEHFLEFAKWDFQTRAVNISPVPGTIEVHEFDYKGVNQVVYQKNGATIRSIPAVHAGDGPVSFILEYAGIKIVIGGDTFPNKWFIEHAKGADLVIHEAFLGPELFVKLYNQPPGLAWRACCAFHTSGQAFGKVMSVIQPKHAVAFHFFTLRQHPGDLRRTALDGDRHDGLEHHPGRDSRAHGGGGRGGLVGARRGQTASAGGGYPERVHALHLAGSLGRGRAARAEEDAR